MPVIAAPFSSCDTQVVAALEFAQSGNCVQEAVIVQEGPH